MGSHVENGTRIPSTNEPLWRETQCSKSDVLSDIAGCNIFLKFENQQPARSFKSRGIGYLMQQAMKQALTNHGSNENVHFFCSSGGNAGIACATAAIQLQRPATIVVPLSASPLMVSKLKTLTAHTPLGAVHQVGAHWSEADDYLRSELLAKTPGGVYVPPFDHPDVWTGAATMVEELDRELPDGFDALVTNVGGGGLFAGVAQGLEERKSKFSTTGHPLSLFPVPRLLLVETQGADSLAASMAAGKLVTLPGITSIALSLGAARVAEKAFLEAQRLRATSVVVSDADAAMSAVRFADDVGVLVEVACGASLAPIYNGQLKKILGEDLSDEEWRQKRVVVIVCGGNNVTLSILQGYIEKYAAATSWT